MGPPSACNACGKKFKVFVSKKKCIHCTDVVCKACLPAHLELKHTPLRQRPRGLNRRKSLEQFDELHFGLRDSELEDGDSGSPDGPEGADNASDEDEEVDLFDYDVVEDDDLLMASLVRQGSVEEEETQYSEMLKIQGAVAAWALKEKQVKQDMRAKKKNRLYQVSPLFPEVCNHENCTAFAVTYAVVATVAIWALFALLLVVYLHGRRLPVVDAL